MKRMTTQKRNVLLVDDNKDILRMFSQVLRKKGYSVVEADSGREALEWMAKSAFDAAVIDLNLPDEKATDLLLKIEGTAPKMARIVLTGSPEPTEIHDAPAQLADAVLLKPIKPEAFLTTLEEKMRNR